jgi:hypothetical protein
MAWKDLYTVAERLRVADVAPKSLLNVDWDTLPADDDYL